MPKIPMGCRFPLVLFIIFMFYFSFLVDFVYIYILSSYTKKQKSYVYDQILDEKKKKKRGNKLIKFYANFDRQSRLMHIEF